MFKEPTLLVFLPQLSLSILLPFSIPFFLPETDIMTNIAVYADLVTMKPINMLN